MTTIQFEKMLVNAVDEHTREYGEAPKQIVVSPNDYIALTSLVPGSRPVTSIMLRDVLVVTDESIIDGNYSMIT